MFPKSIGNPVFDFWPLGTALPLFPGQFQDLLVGLRACRSYLFIYYYI